MIESIAQTFEYLMPTAVVNYPVLHSHILPSFHTQPPSLPLAYLTNPNHPNPLSDRPRMLQTAACFAFSG